MKKIWQARWVWLFVAGLLEVGTGGWAASITWDGGGGNTSWNSATNWSNNQLPVTTNDYTIAVAGGANTTLDADFTIQKFMFNYAGAGSLAGGSGGPRTLTLSNGVSGLMWDLRVAQNYIVSNDVTIALLTNSVISVYGPGGAAGGNLTLAGVISGPGCALSKNGYGILTLLGTNTYDGPTTVTTGLIAVANTSALGGSGQNVTISGSGSTLGALGFIGQSLTQAMLTERVTPASVGTLAMGASTANDLDFTGLLTRLGAMANASYTGTLTPDGSIYKVGGGGATLTFPNANTFVDSGGARSLDVNITAAFNSKVLIPVPNTFSGGTTLVGPVTGTAGLALEIRANGAVGAGAITLKGGTLAFSTSPQTVTNPISTVTGGATANSEIYANNVPVTLLSGLDVGGGTTLQINQVYANNHLVILTQPSTGTGSLQLVRGALSISNENQLPPGNFDRGTSGVLVFDGVTWEQFAANRSRGFGSGTNQWSGALSCAARGTPLVISTNGIPGFNPATYADAGGAKVYTYFDRNVLFGSVLTKDGQLYANAPVTVAVNTVLSSRRSWNLSDTGPGLYGTHTNGIVYTITGNISDEVAQGLGVNRGTIGGPYVNTLGEFVFAGTNDFTGSAFVDNIGTPVYHGFSTGPGGFVFSRQVSDNVLLRFDGNQSLPRGNNGSPAHLSKVGPGISGYLVTARPAGETYELPAGMKFVLGSSVSGRGVLGSSGLPGWSATLCGSDVCSHRSITETDGASGITNNIVVRGGSLTLGEPGKPLCFIPTFGMHSNATDPGISAPATAIFDAALVTGTWLKLNSGTLILGNVAYTDLARTADKAGQYIWQIGRNSLGNQGGSGYSDGAIRGLADTDPLAGNSNSLKNFNIYLAGGGYEVDGRGSASVFTRALGAAASQVRWGNGAGGFSAYNGPLTVSIGGTADTLTWASTVNFVANNDAMIFGSQTANDSVSLINTVALNNATREIRVIDNPDSTTDKAVLVGPLTGTSSAALRKAGDGILELAASNTYAGVTILSNGTLVVNGALSPQSSLVTVTAGASLGGTGTVYRPVTVVSNGMLAAGNAGSVGTLTIASNLTLAAGAGVNWDYSNGVGDRVNVGGTLTLPASGTVNVTSLGGGYPGDRIVFSANQLAGSSDLSGWTVDGMNAILRVVGTEVRMVLMNGTMIVVQ